MVHLRRDASARTRIPSSVLEPCREQSYTGIDAFRRYHPIVLLRQLVILTISSAFFRLAAAQIGELSLGSSANEQGCQITKPGSEFPSAIPQIFFRFVTTRVAPGESLRVEWVSPGGAVESKLDYDQLPAAPAICILTQLPVGGFRPATLPGIWTARVVAGDRLLGMRQFRLIEDPNAGRGVIRNVTRRDISPQETELLIEGAGLDPGTIVNIAQYTPAGGWTYIAHLLPAELDAEKVLVRLPALKPAEYLVILKDAQGKLSAPARFVIASAGYRLPVRAGESWILTQGPYGGFSHYGRSLHAYDIAPMGGTCIVAMRPGVVYAHDFGYGQTPHLRIFGNYITIAHDDGEFSHYAHLQTGTFVVRTGQRVEQGQGLARVGNSGYSFGRHVHVHVTKGQWISNQSIPFRFEDLPQGPSFRGAFYSKNESPLGDCSRPATAPPSYLSSSFTPAPAGVGGGAAAPPRPATWTGQVTVGEWWSQTTNVPAGAKSLEVAVGWEDKDRELELMLVSPNGQQFAVFADARGYQIAGDTEKKIALPQPQPGMWRVYVQGTRGAAEATGFKVFRNLVTR